MGGECCDWLLHAGMLLLHRWRGPAEIREDEQPSEDERTRGKTGLDERRGAIPNEEDEDTLGVARHLAGAFYNHTAATLGRQVAQQ